MVATAALDPTGEYAGMSDAQIRKAQYSKNMRASKEDRAANSKTENAARGAQDAEIVKDIERLRGVRVMFLRKQAGISGGYI